MIACVAVPYFAAAVERRDDTALAETPLVIGGQPWEPRPLYAFSREAARQGVRPGMLLRQAHVLAPRSHFMPADQRRYFQSAGEMFDCLADVTPHIEPEEAWHPRPEQGHPPVTNLSLPARYYLDLEGLPPREAIPLARHMGQRVRQETGLAPAVGLAGHPFTAQVAAALARPNHARPVPPGEEAAFLAPRSIRFLPLDKETARRLHLLGIRTLGQFAGLPLPALKEQFGPAIERLHRLAQGQAAAPIRARPPAPVLQVMHQFDGAVDNRLALTAALARAARELAIRLERAGREGRTLRLVWEMEEGGCLEQEQSLRRPTAETERLATALRECLARAPLTAAVTALTVTVGGLTAAAAQQLSLFAASAAAALDGRLQYVMLKYGADYFYRPALADRRHPLPERRFQLQGWSHDAALA